MKKLTLSFIFLPLFLLSNDDNKEAKRGALLALKMVEKELAKESYCKIDKTACSMCSVLVSTVKLEILEHPELLNKKPPKPLPESIIKKIDNESLSCKDKDSKQCSIFKKVIQEKFNEFDGSEEEFEKMVDNFIKTVSNKIKFKQVSSEKL